MAAQTEKTNRMLESKLTDTDAAMKEYKTLKAQEAELKAKLAEADRKYADAMKDAEIERMKAVAELEKEVAALKAKVEVLSEKKSDKNHNVLYNGAKVGCRPFER